MSWVVLVSLVVMGVDDCGCFEGDENYLVGVDTFLPGVRILQPTEGSQYAASDTVHLAAAIPANTTVMLQSWSVRSESNNAVSTVSSTLLVTRIAPGLLASGAYDAIFLATVTNADGLHYTTADTVRFSIAAAPNAAPTAFIVRPADGDEVTADSLVILEGVGQDAEDGDLAASALSWSSDIDGLLGTGSPLLHPGLSAGNHVLTLTATDSQGAQGSVSATVLAKGPVATIRGRVTIGGEPRGQVVMELSGPESRFTSTFTDGRYLFTDLTPGDYVVRVHPPTGAEFANPTQSVTVSLGQEVVVDFAGS